MKRVVLAVLNFLCQFMSGLYYTPIYGLHYMIRHNEKGCIGCLELSLLIYAWAALWTHRSVDRVKNTQNYSANDLSSS